jgi:nicotinate-nucleotide adenylyltransferase
MDTSGNKLIGIYGGSFDPVHYGHLRTAVEVQELFSLDELRLMPCYQSPLKPETVTHAIDRVAMLQLAIENQAGFIVDSREINRQGASYMVDSLASLRMDFPDATLLLFIGMDAFNQLENWHCWQQLFDYAHIIVMTRPEIETKRMGYFLYTRLVRTLDELKTQPAGKLFFQSVTGLDISATKIRRLIAHKANLHFLLPDSVIHYINVHNLYRTL